MDLSTLQPGQTLTVEPIEVSEGGICAYRDAVGGATAAPNAAGAAPAMALAAWALGSAMRAVELPEGAIHISQELDFARSVRPEDDLRCTTVVAQNSVRRSVRFLVIAVSVARGTEEMLRGSATITIKEETVNEGAISEGTPSEGTPSEGTA